MAKPANNKVIVPSQDPNQQRRNKKDAQNRTARARAATNREQGIPSRPAPVGLSTLAREEYERNQRLQKAAAAQEARDAEQAERRQRFENEQMDLALCDPRIFERPAMSEFDKKVCAFARLIILLWRDAKDAAAKAGTTRLGIAAELLRNELPKKYKHEAIVAGKSEAEAETYARREMAKVRKALTRAKGVAHQALTYGYEEAKKAQKARKNAA